MKWKEIIYNCLNNIFILYLLIVVFVVLCNCLEVYMYLLSQILKKKVKNLPQTPKNCISSMSTINAKTAQRTIFFWSNNNQIHQLGCVEYVLNAQLIIPTNDIPCRRKSSDGKIWSLLVSTFVVMIQKIQSHGDTQRLIWDILSWLDRHEAAMQSV